MKRTLISTILGLGFGFVCYGLASKNGALAMPIAISIIAGRTLIGFVIGISNIKWNWALHGLVIGFIVSIPGSFAAMTSTTAAMCPSKLFFATAIAGAVYGLLIELLTSKVFKAPRA